MSIGIKEDRYAEEEIKTQSEIVAKLQQVRHAGLAGPEHYRRHSPDRRERDHLLSIAAKDTSRFSHDRASGQKV
jgi:hypothetical protein